MEKKGEIKLKSKVDLDNIKSKHILKEIFEHIKKNKALEIIKINKKIQNKLNLTINDYKEYSELFTPIEIEITPKASINKIFNNFINLTDKEEEYYHIFFNDRKEEIKKFWLNEEDKVTKIKIIIDYQIKSFKMLFYFCQCIESIFFKKFYRNNIIDMSGLFWGCSTLKEIDISNINQNVTDMNYMFCGCSSLEGLNLSNFSTNNVKDMKGMFFDCSSLKEINLSNFNTNNVTDMSSMFGGCSSLKVLNLSNFNTNNVTDMSFMFIRCSSLEELNISNFNINKVINMIDIFYGCSDELKKKISEKNTNIPYFDFD